MALSQLFVCKTPSKKLSIHIEDTFTRSAKRSRISIGCGSQAVDSHGPQTNSNEILDLFAFNRRAGIETVRAAWLESSTVLIDHGSPNDARSLSEVGLITAAGFANVPLDGNRNADRTNLASESPSVGEIDPVAVHRLADVAGLELPEFGIRAAVTAAPVPAMGSGTASESVIAIATPRFQNPIEIGAPNVQPPESSTAAFAADRPFIPPPGRQSIATQTAPHGAAVDRSNTEGASDVQPTGNSPPNQHDSVGQTAPDAGSWDTVSGTNPGTGTNPGNGDGHAFAGQGNCSGNGLGGGNGGQQGLGGQAGNGNPGTTPPCDPPGQQTSSLDDPLFVVSWNDGIVLFENIIEFDKPGDWQDLRAQVYGATVSSYSWNTSQAPAIACVSGSTS